MRPAPDEIAAPHAGYVARVPEEDIMPVMEHQSAETQRLLSSIDEQRGDYRYADGKWSIKEVFGHLADTERILCYRALAIARGEQQPLPGFDEDLYAKNAGYDAWSVTDLAEQYALVRKASIVFFRHLTAEAWDRRGIASQRQTSVRALAYTIVGHERHHMSVLRERYHIE